MKSLILIGLCLLAGQSHAELRWQQYHGKLPYNAVIGGYEQGRVLYICQAYFNNGLHPGKVVEHRLAVEYRKISCAALCCPTLPYAAE